MAGFGAVAVGAPERHLDRPIRDVDNVEDTLHGSSVVTDLV